LGTEREGRGTEAGKREGDRERVRERREVGRDRESLDLNAVA